MFSNKNYTFSAFLVPLKRQIITLKLAAILFFLKLAKPNFRVLLRTVLNEMNEEKKNVKNVNKVNVKRKMKCQKTIGEFC